VGAEEGGALIRLFQNMATPNTVRGCALAVAWVCGVLGSAAAQDRRQVAEPQIPATACATLLADKQVGPDRAMAAADEQRPDTARIQAALDACPAGQAVALKPGQGGNVNAFLSGPLQLRSGVTLLVDQGVTLYASRNPLDYDWPATPGLCGSMATPANAAKHPGSAGCRPLIAVRGVKGAAVMGEGTIDGRGDMPLMGRPYSWWQLARQAEPGNIKYSSVRLIVANQADGLVLYGIHLHNSPNFHVTVNGTDGFTAWGVHLRTPTVAGADARNTDGIDPGSSTNITVAHSWLATDDDNIAVKTGVSHMSVLHNHFYNGHGMSIGSETYTGQSHLLVDDLVLDHTTSGVRIKSNVLRGGPVHDLLYQNICMRDVPVPIAISPYYNNTTTDPFTDPGHVGDKVPDYKGITLRNVTATTPGDVLIAGHDEQHRTQLTLDNVHIAAILPQQVHVRLADITAAATDIPLQLPAQGNAVKLLAGAAAAAKPYVCDGKFVPMR
jgi:polygalacturonase